ncbi:MAG: hypothetical protein GXO56_06890 [Chloroflexi bacterium]|nr:hypothetical protein [Chloroflexota bacterium]
MRNVTKAVGYVLVLVGVIGLGWGLWPQPTQTWHNTANGVAMTFRAPTVMRRGEAVSAQMHLALADQPATSAPLHFEIQLVTNGFAVSPEGLLTLTLAPGQQADLAWQLQGDTSGDFQGALWVYRLLPDGSTEALFNHPLRVRVISLLGLGGQQARLLGVFALTLAGLLYFYQRSERT